MLTPRAARVIATHILNQRLRALTSKPISLTDDMPAEVWRYLTLAAQAACDGEHASYLLIDSLTRTEVVP